ncbi:MAG TPA: GNAT family N-acetyltransferase [Gemmatimonadaceae bacterium]|nr:GNAT family N-acetyltransferase [Gemmatimonadaceae bacterium]
MTSPATPGRADTELNDLVIRRASEADAGALAAFARRTFVETFGEQNTDENMAIHVARTFGDALQLAEIRDVSMVTLVGEVGGTMAGFAQVRRGSAPACVGSASPIEVLRFYVDRPFQGRGIAPALMRAALNVARELGGRTAWLGVWEQNPRAIAFYAKCGFVDVGSHTFVLGTETQTDRVMAQRL